MLEIVDLKRKAGDFSLHIEHLSLAEGDLMVLLGPSGSGKTMLLELIAGLEKADSGQVVLDHQDITKTPASQRSVGMVFQKQWLFPHMSVEENIAYGLKNKGLTRAEIKNRVHELASLTHCTELLKRKADKLSGGEAQRVAIARTLALKPRILLLDEPLANLDSSLRADVLSLIRQLHRKGQTIIHVTHDYREAIALAINIVVMHQGRVLQQGAPTEVFSRPRNAFVASFAGIRNYFAGTLLPADTSDSNLKIFKSGQLSLWLTSAYTPPMTGQVIIPARAITISSQAVQTSAVNQFEGVVIDLFDLPEGVEVSADVRGTTLRAVVTRQSVERLSLGVGAKVFLQFKAGSVDFEPD
ncbi:MAG: ABC transporter ATP-binding protein [Bacteroidetes bacterium]|nr:ABC transporter ATP-binding protein [Bacteroidota bacterium]